MKKIVVILCCFPFFATAQNFYASARLGMTNYQGDLKASSVSFAQSKLLFSLGARYDFSEHLAARTHFSLTSLHADDKNGTTSMQQRNLNFRSKIFDWELGAQYSLFSFNDKWWTPYVFAGVGFFHFNPYTNDSAGTRTFLKPLSTEGEGFVPGIKNYKLWQFSIPFGFGAEYSLNEDMRLGLEFGYRKIFTDNLMMSVKAMWTRQRCWLQGDKKQLTWHGAVMKKEEALIQHPVLTGVIQNSMMPIITWQSLILFAWCLMNIKK